MSARGVAVVTGGSAGVGREAVRALAARGWDVAVLARATQTAPQMEARNPSDAGGEISNGMATLRQMLARPVPRWNTYRTPQRGVYLCSAATPPGPAVHGMSGDNAARAALGDVFGLSRPPRPRAT